MSSPKQRYLSSSNCSIWKDHCRFSFLQYAMLLFVLFSLVCSALPAFSYDAAPSDPQEAVIKKVLYKTGEAFGWGPSYYFLDTYDDGRTEKLTPNVWGPRQMSDLVQGEWVNTPGAGYGFNVVVPGEYGGWDSTPFRILAYPTQEIAQQNMQESLDAVKQNPEYSKITDFHGYKAIEMGNKMLDWNMDRFMFSVIVPQEKKMTAREMAEELYQIAVQYDLLSGSKGNNVDTDTDTNEDVVVPEVKLGVQLEVNPVTGKPFEGIVADGKSTVEVQIHLDSSSEGELKLSKKPFLGTISGDSLRYGKVQLVDGKATLRYTAPGYVKQTQITLLNDSISNGYALVPIGFTYTTEEGTKKEFELDLHVYRTPIMLVHGFTGDVTTWARLSDHLQAKQYDTHIGEYYALDHSIQAQSRMLKQNIQKKIKQYAYNNIRMTRADIVAHSMGGLISRFYTNGAPYYANDVRKLIMVGTPNHGCSWSDLQLGRLNSYLGNKHKTAAEQLYQKNPFIVNLNKNEAYGLHLNSAIEYGNIYSYSALPGFFSGDMVVASASAYLNGVSSYMVTDNVHSTAFSSMGQAITTNPKIFARIERWLNGKIYRSSLRNVEVLITKAEGDVFIDKDGANKMPVDASMIENVKTLGNALHPFDLFSTGNGKAMISLSINKAPWGYIHVTENTDLRLGYVSPRLIEVKLLKGSARFTTFKILGKGHFSVSLTNPTGEWQNITGLNTDFVVSAEGNPLVTSLEGDLIVASETKATGQKNSLPGNATLEDSSLTDVTISSKQSVTVGSTGNPEVTTQAMTDTWWQDPFYKGVFGGWYGAYFIYLKDSIVMQYRTLRDRLQNGGWGSFTSQDVQNFSLLGYAVLLGFVLLLLLLIALFGRKWKLLWVIPIVFVLAVVAYTVTQCSVGLL